MDLHKRALMRHHAFHPSIPAFFQCGNKGFREKPEIFLLKGIARNRLPPTICQQELKLRGSDGSLQDCALCSAEGFITISPLMGNYVRINKRN